VLHDRNPLAVQTVDGGVRNGYTVRLLNKRAADRKVALVVAGAPGLKLEIVGEGAGSTVTVGPDQTLELRVLVSTPAGAVPAQAIPVTFTAEDAAGAGKTTTVSATDHFFPQ
jgi:polyferredoxin